MTAHTILSRVIYATAFLAVALLPAARAEGPPERLTSKQRATAPKVKPLAVGDELRTEAGQRRRAVLPDGSVVYVNQDTRIKINAPRRLALTAGEVFVEVTPGDAFVVTTPKRDVTAAGTRFAVRADAKGTGVLVARGKVKVAGLDTPLHAGQQLAPDSDKPMPSPRATHALDWTKDLMAAAESPLVPASQHAGGALVAVDPDGQEAKLSLRKYHIDVHIEDGFARTTIDQTYFNHHDARLEGTFYFPLPADASLSRLAMYVDGTRMEGGIVERDLGRAVYEEIVYRQKDPALLEWVDGSTFKMRVFPLEARQEKRIILSYTQRLPSLYGQLQYRFPAGHSLDSVREWPFHARIKNGAAAGWSSASHKMTAKQDGKDLLLDAAEKDVRLNRDVLLNFADESTGKARFSSMEQDGAKYLMLRYRPILPTGEPAALAAGSPRTWLFLFESSGDRDPLLARAQIDVIRALLSQAEPDDSFVVLSAGTRVRALSDKPQLDTPENVSAAITFLESSHLIGALDLDRGLSEAASLLKDAKNGYLVHVGSGIAAMGEKRDDVLAKRISEGTRYIGVGVGKRWARSFMKTAAERTGGYFTQINPDEPIAWRAFELAATLNTPRLLDVQVVDKAGKTTFLPFTTLVNQGEELCAVARIGRAAGVSPLIEPSAGLRPPLAMPEVVVIRGTLNGRPFERELPVRDVTPNAGYLPRTWAKLEIERLLGEYSREPKDDVKNRIIALSKSMYVMTPFTSLLVLENEEMYQQYKVDRGRKDHWAMYACPDKIPVVAEDADGQPIDPRKGAKPTARQVKDTILTRGLPRFLRVTGDEQQQMEALLNRWLLSKFVDPETKERWERELITGNFKLGQPHYNIISSGFNGSGKPALVTERMEDKYGSVRSSSARVESPVLMLERMRRDQTVILNMTRAWADRTPQRKSIRQGLNDAENPGPDLGISGGSGHALQAPASLLPSLPNERMTQLINESEDFRLIEGRGTMRSERPGFGFDATIKKARFQPPYGGFPGFQEQFQVLGDDFFDRREIPSLLYHRPSYSGDERFFFDLVSYAPGMNVSRADVLAVIEAEAATMAASKAGKIDEAAKRLLNQSRHSGWMTYRTDGLTITFDGSGRYVAERSLPPGIRERVVCDGKTILHLYPDLGIGARRTVSRFHRLDFAWSVPWFVPPAEDLAHGADLMAVDDRTVAIVPHGIETLKDEKGKPIPYARIHLLFVNGQLAERQIVEMPAKKVLLREVYGADGVVKVLDGDGKELTTHKGTLSAAREPDLKADTSKLVVLPLPYRDPNHVRKSLKIENKPLEQLRFEDALALFAAYFGQGKGNEALQVFRQSFHGRNQRQIGFYVLLAALGQNLDAQNVDVLAEHLNEPLAQYLALHSSPVLRKHASQWAVGSGQWGEGYLHHLAVTHALYQRWQNPKALGETGAKRQAELERALDYVRRNKGTIFGWALLALVQDATSNRERDTHRALAEAWPLFADMPGLEYAARYETARSLWKAGQREEGRKRFRELYDKTFADGDLPAIDADFRAALLGDGKEPDIWSDLIRKTAARLIEKKERPAVLTLAWQCQQLEDEPLAYYLLSTALDSATDKERPALTLAAVEFHAQNGQLEQAERTLQKLLDDPKLAANGSQWRLASQLAERRDNKARAVDCLERALDAEYRHLPPVINVKSVREDYGKLLEHYQNQADALVSLKLAAPADFVAKTVRAADRWRALDSDGEAACQAAGHILQALGERELVWDYLTTPVGLHPNESGPWQGLAHTLSRRGELDLADRAFTAAFDSEPTNAQILWDRATNLRQAGKLTEAKKLYRQLAEGKWQPRFTWLQTQARWQMER
jgi:ferric-dicitrate binding protein FerR (iron transport regulator)